MEDRTQQLTWESDLNGRRWVSEEKHWSEYVEIYKRGHPNTRGSKSSNTSLRDGMTSDPKIAQDGDGVNAQKTERGERSGSTWSGGEA